MMWDLSMRPDHRTRLQAAGLFTPTGEGERKRRRGLLAEVCSGKKMRDKPIYVVYRSSPYHHVTFIGDEVHGAADAERIEELLYSWEAHNLCNRLNYHDSEQPPRSNPYLPPLECYHICDMWDWEKWEKDGA